MNDEDASSEESASDDQPTLAEKLDRCFITMHPADRGPWSVREVSAGVAELGVTVSPSYLWQLRTGKSKRIRVDQLQALAKFFHIPMSYFVGDDVEVDRIDAQMAVVRAMRNPAVRDVALRASSLTPDGLRAVARIIEELGTVQGMAARRTSTNQPTEVDVENLHEAPEVPDTRPG